ncbi:hypothetical protein ES703_56344 [subsurface metagenome]
MGQRLEDDTIITGDACTGCEGILWDPGCTPKTVYVRFSQLERCPDIDWTENPVPPNNRVFTLEQVDGFPCRWYVLTADEWSVSWQLSWGVDLRSRLFLDRPGMRNYFQGLTAPNLKCVGSFENKAVCNGLFFSHGGFGWVEWKQIAIDQAKNLGIALAPTLFYEVFQIDIETVVYKFTDIARGINVKSKLFRP